MDSVSLAGHQRSAAQPAGPKVRAACEACHQRKIRCQMLAEGNSCQACDAGNRKCYFIPRAKAGRPRLSRNRPSERSVIDSETISRADEFDNWQDMASIDNSSSMDMSPDLDWTELSNLESSNLYNEDYTMVADVYHNRHLRHPTSTDLAIDKTSSSSRFPEPSFSFGGSAPSEFATVLNICTGLQTMHQNIQSVWTQSSPLLPISSARLQTILQNLDTAGEGIVHAATQTSGGPKKVNPSTSSLPALLMATLLKMLEICDVLIQSATPKIQTLSQVQLFKRIDFNIMQTRTALRKLAEFNLSLANIAREVSSVTSRLHHEIRVGLEGLPAELGGHL